MEGLQAACASDYSIAQFRFLKRLLFVHGSWNYSRMCKLILYSFYKNICLYVIELWFAIYSGWSGQILFERWSIGLYNVVSFQNRCDTLHWKIESTFNRSYLFFSRFSPLRLHWLWVFSIKCVPPKLTWLTRDCTRRRITVNHSSILRYWYIFIPLIKLATFEVMCLSKVNSENYISVFKQVFWIWIANALIHSSLLYWLPLMALKQDVAWANGRDGGYLLLGNFVYTVSVAQTISAPCNSLREIYGSSCETRQSYEHVFFRSML